MAIKAFRAGVSNIAVPTPNGVALPSLQGMAFTASGVVLDDVVHNSIQTALATGVNYQVCIGLTGHDTTTDGYSTAPTTASSGVLTLSAGQNAIAVTVLNASWPANFKYAGYVTVFLAQGQGDFQVAKKIAVDPSNDMVMLITAAPLAQAGSYPIATLTSTTTMADNSLGDRKPEGFTFSTITPTTRDVTQTDRVAGSVTFTPNTAGDFTIATVRDFTIEFFSLANDVKTFIQASAGEYGAYTTGGHTYYQSQRAYQTTQIIVKGCMPLILTMPTDPLTGVGETVLCTSLLLQNQQELAMAWSKRNETPVRWFFQTVPDDQFINNLPTVWSSARK